MRRLRDPNSFFIGEIRDVSSLSLRLSLSCASRKLDSLFPVGERVLVWYPSGQSLLISVARLRRITELQDRTHLAVLFENFSAERDEYLARLAGNRIRQSRSDMGLPGYGLA